MTIHKTILSLIIFLLPLISQAQLKISASTNFPALIKKLPNEVDRPLAREIRYTYGSALELQGKKKKTKDPFVVTNEQDHYERKTTPGTDWNYYFKYQAKSMDQSHIDFLDKYEDQLSVEAMEGYMAIKRSVQTSIAALQTYLAVMGALSSLAVAWAEKDASTLVSWTETTTKCIGNEAPVGSVLHLEVMWLVKGQSFKFHSENDLWVTATLETGDGRWVTSRQIMQMWVDTKKKKVSPENTVPLHESIPDEKKELLDPLYKRNGILPLQAILVNAAVQDLELRLEALAALSDGVE
ncbi:MAG: hypothetical protein O6848_00615 [Bacteroidetes bacterium]|nr:hypothetical protein [Bacteroidota bacterium]